MYDVIVIGAGPAGCTAAKTLSDKGYKVLLTERFALPRNKSCSGILIKKSVELIKLCFGADVPDSVKCEPFRSMGMILTDEKGREYRFEQEGINILRSRFDHWLAQLAEKSGAEVRECASAVSCSESEGSVEVCIKGSVSSKYTERASYIIDCEGVAGTLRRSLVNTPAKNNIHTFQTFYEGSVELDPHYFYAYLQPELSEYDAWFNVKDNMLVLGTAVRDPAGIDFYFNSFISYMKDRHNLKIKNKVKAEKWIMPRISSGCDVNYGMGRVLFAGETAGFLNPMGEGISAAVESAFNAANAVSKHFNNPDFVIQDYKSSSLNLRTYMQRQWAFTAELSGTFSEMKL
jgi:flavin-dependent dehydrogenase